MKKRILSLIMSAVMTASFMVSPCTHAFNIYEYGEVVVTVIDEETNELFKEPGKFGMTMVDDKWDASVSNPYTVKNVPLHGSYFITYDPDGMVYDGYYYEISDCKPNVFFQFEEGNDTQNVTVYMQKRPIKNKVEYGTITVTVIDEETNELFTEDRAGGKSNFEMYRSYITNYAPKEESSKTSTSDMSVFFGGTFITGSWNTAQSNPHTFENVVAGNYMYHISHIGIEHDGFTYMIDEEKSDNDFIYSSPEPKEVKIYMKKDIWANHKFDTQMSAPEYKIVKLPDKVEYKIGEMIDLKGLDIEVTRDNEEPIVYTYPDVAFDYQSNIPRAPRVILHSDFRSDKAGTYKVKVVGAENVSFEVRVVDEETQATGKEELYPKLVKCSKNLSVSEVKELAKKGSKLDWSDFEEYGFEEIGSGLRTLMFEVEGGYTLYVGNDPNKSPYFALLTHNNENGIDIRESDVEAFLNETSECTFKGSTIETVFDVIEYPKKTVYTAGDELDLSGIAVKCHSETYWHTENNDKRYVFYGEPYTVDNITLDGIDAWVYDDSGINTRAVKGDMFNTLKSGTYRVAYGESYQYGDKEIRFCDFMYEVSIKDDTDKKTSAETFTVLEINNNIMMLKPVEGSALLRSGERFTMTTKELGSDITPTVGMKLDITYWGVLESYPAQFGYVSKVAVVKDEDGFISGDANCDEQVDMADAVLIMQALANPDRYGENGKDFRRLTSLGKLNGDMNGDGLTVGDALAIQKKLLGLSDEKQSAEALIGKTYVYEKEGSFTITFNEYGRYACYEKDILSYMTEGTWELNGDTVKLVYCVDEGTEKAVYLKVKGSDLVYIGEKSDNFTDVKVQDGEKFTDTKIRSKVDWYEDYMVSLKKDTDWSRKNNNLSAVIKDTDGLKSYLEQFCNEKAMSVYLDKYNDSFFKDNVLFMKWIFQGSSSTGPIYIVNVTMQPDNGLGMFVMYNGLNDGDDMASVCLAQVTVPKEIYDDSKEYNWVGYNVMI